jgi:predicted esterase
MVLTSVPTPHGTEPTAMTASLAIASSLALAWIAQEPAAAPDRPTNRLGNPSVEAGTDQPDAWRQSAGVAGVKYLWDSTVAADGKRSLSIRKEGERFFPFAAWQQDVAHDGRAVKLHFGALIKSAAAHKAVLDVGFLVDGKQTGHQWAAYVGAKTGGDPPAEHDWLWCSGVVAVPAGTQQLRLALQMWGPGQVWFDRLAATIVDAATPTTDAAATPAQPASAYGELPQPAVAVVDASLPAPLALEGDSQRRYYLIPARGKPPTKGHALLVVLPGGDGSADFRPFVGRIAEQALGEDFVVAQLVAPAHPKSAELVWPKRRDKVPTVKVATEDFIAQVIAAAQKAHAVDAERVFLLGWSSSGPACYATVADAAASVRGAFVAMSVFHAQQLAKIEGVAGRAVYVLHSPDDKIPLSFAQTAVQRLAAAGAKTELATYEGGHGWHGDVFGQIRTGVRWLEAKATPRRAGK